MKCRELGRSAPSLPSWGLSPLSLHVCIFFRAKRPDGARRAEGNQAEADEKGSAKVLGLTSPQQVGSVGSHQALTRHLAWAHPELSIHCFPEASPPFSALSVLEKSRVSQVLVTSFPSGALPRCLLLRWVTRGPLTSVPNIRGDSQFELWQACV